MKKHLTLESMMIIRLELPVCKINFSNLLKMNITSYFNRFLQPLYDFHCSWIHFFECTYTVVHIFTERLLPSAQIYTASFHCLQWVCTQVLYSYCYTMSGKWIIYRKLLLLIFIRVKKGRRLVELLAINISKKIDRVSIIYKKRRKIGKENRKKSWLLYWL